MKPFYIAFILTFYVLCAVALYKEIDNDCSKVKRILMSTFWPFVLFVYAIASVFNF
jgi:hypothetical protein